MSRTLTDILETMPDAGWQRFSEAFWVAKANFVLNEIETKLSGPYMNIEVAMPIVDRVTMYPIPKNVRTIKRIRLPSSTYLGMTNEDPSTKIPYSFLGNQFRLLYPVSLSGNVDLNLTQTISSNILLTVAGGDGVDQSGKAAIITHLDRTSETLIVASQKLIMSGIQVQTTILRLNGTLKQPCAVGEAFILTSDFIMIEGRTGFDKFTSFSSLSPLPAEWDRALAKGLRFWLEAQQDEQGNARIQDWYKLFMADLEQIDADYNEFDGDNYPVQPRSKAMFAGLRVNDRNTNHLNPLNNVWWQ